MADQDRNPVLRDRPIGRQVAVGFGLVSTIAVTMCVMLLAVIAEVAGTVDRMRADESAIRDSLGLATAVREQYIHVAHSLLTRDETHLDHYQEWVHAVDERVASLRVELPDGHGRRLGEIDVASDEMDRLFREVLLPAAKSGRKLGGLRENTRAEALSGQAASLADGIVREVEWGMAEAHADAVQTTRAGLIYGGICVLLVVGVSVVYTVRLRRAVLQPLNTLVAAAGRVGAGEFDARIGSDWQNELGIVARAFDRMTEELHARERRMLQAERMAAIGQIAAGIAHELNNPIGIIRGYLKTMSPEADPETLREELGILDEEASACQRIAEDLLAYARIPEIRQEPVPIASFLEETVARLRQDPELAGARIEVRSDDADVPVDAARMRQVLANLLKNASQAGGPDAPIELVGEAVAPGHYRLEVRDGGHGIPEKDRQRIFEPFYSGRQDGSGLGLAVVQGIVEQHGGTIVALERPEGGTIMRIDLGGPLKEGEA